MLLKPLLKYKIQSTGRKQSEEIIVSELCQKYLLPPSPKLESLKLVTSPEKYSLQCPLIFFSPPNLYHSTWSRVHFGVSEVTWRPQKYCEDEYTFLAVFEEEKLGCANLQGAKKSLKVYRSLEFWSVHPNEWEQCYNRPSLAWKVGQHPLGWQTQAQKSTSTVLYRWGQVTTDDLNTLWPCKHRP